MAMPASGSIAIISAPQTCGSICAAVGCASGSLTTLSVAAGKTAPHCMREFYGYSSGPACVTLSSINSCNNYTTLAYCLSELCTIGMGAGQCYVPTICYVVINTPCSKAQNSCAALYCNGVQVCVCNNSSTAYIDGTFTPLISYGEGWCFCTCASLALKLSGAPSANACMTITSVQCCVGDYTLCNPIDQQSYVLNDI